MSQVDDNEQSIPVDRHEQTMPPDSNEQTLPPDSNEQTLPSNSNEQTVNDTLAAMSAQQLSTLAFNLGAISWIGLNLSFDGVVPVYQPGCFVSPNLLNVLCALVLLYSTYLACRAVARGSLMPCFLVFTFAFSLLMTIYRQLTF